MSTDNKKDKPKFTQGYHRLPDGSGFALGTLPLPKDHWIYEETGEPSMPFKMGVLDPVRVSAQEKVREAAKHAIRGATMNGEEKDFDPDALIQNLIVGLFGYHTKDGSEDGEMIPGRKWLQKELPRVEGHRWCPWCKKPTPLSAECFDDEDTVWAVLCETCRGGGPMAAVSGDIEGEGEEKAFELWDSDEAQDSVETPTIGFGDFSICPGCRSKDEEHSFDPCQCTLVGAFGTDPKDYPEVFGKEEESLGASFSRMRKAFGDSVEDIFKMIGVSRVGVSLLEGGRLPEDIICKYFKMYVSFRLGDRSVPEGAAEAMEEVAKSLGMLDQYEDSPVCGTSIEDQDLSPIRKDIQSTKMGSAIREIRKRFGLSLGDLARAMNRGVSEVSDYERGKGSVGDMDKEFKAYVAAVLDTDRDRGSVDR